jgi:hypothetical protein
MKLLPLCAIIFSVFFASCATAPVRVSQSENCDAKKSYAKGKKDADMGMLPSTFLFRSCDSEQRKLALKAYKRGYEARSETPALEEPENREENAWVCEIEANAKVFTGVGISQEEAIQSARKTCGSHMQSSSCGSTECRKTL